MLPEDEKEWTLAGVYRRTSAGHWDKHDFGTSNTGDNPSPTIGAMPKRGYVTVRRLRLRIPLAKESGGASGIREVVRRGDCLLFTSKSRFRGMVLKFPSVRECVQFSDRLLVLNPSSPLPMTTATSDAISSSADSGVSEASLSVAVSKQRYDEPMTGCHGLAEDETDEMREGATDKSSHADLLHVQRNDVFSYMVRLLHDQGFRSFMDKIESCITSSPDGTLMLEALLQQPATAEMPLIFGSSLSEITE